MRVELEAKGVTRFCHHLLCRTPWSHLTAACTLLHSRCHACGNRGHHREDCSSYTQEELLGIFKSVADYGVYTRKRCSHLEWGYSPVIHQDKYCPTIPARSRFPISYDTLVRLPVQHALETVIVFNAAVCNQLGVTDRNFPRDVTDKRPYLF